MSTFKDTFNRFITGRWFFPFLKKAKEDQEISLLGVTKSGLLVKTDGGGAGQQGPPGPQGPQGIQGPVGPQGPPGKDGTNGVDGKDGTNGSPGKDGVDGKDGYTPIKGVDYFDGKDGINGIDGKDGEKGEKGDKGDKGDKGEQGDNGEDGKTPVLEIGTVTTVAAGGNATANVVPEGVDASGNPIYSIDFGIPKGADGSGGTSTRSPRLLVIDEDISEEYRPIRNKNTLLPIQDILLIGDMVVDKAGAFREITIVTDGGVVGQLSDVLMKLSSAAPIDAPEADPEDSVE